MDPENVEVDDEQVGRTAREVWEYNNPGSMGKKPVEPVVEPDKDDASCVKETAPQPTPDSGVALGKYPPPSNFKLMKVPEKVADPLALGKYPPPANFKLRSAGPSIGDKDVEAGAPEQRLPQTAKGGVPGKVPSDPKTKEDTIVETTTPSIRYPINCPDYDWSKDEYHSASEELSVPDPPVLIQKRTDHEKARNPRRILKNPNSEELYESAVRCEKILKGEIKIGDGWKKFQNLLIERPLVTFHIKLYLDTEPNYYYVGEYRGISVDRRRITLVTNGMKQKVCLTGAAQPFWMYTDER